MVVISFWRRSRLRRDGVGPAGVRGVGSTRDDWRRLHTLPVHSATAMMARTHTATKTETHSGSPPSQKPTSGAPLE